MYESVATLSEPNPVSTEPSPNTGPSAPGSIQDTGLTEELLVQLLVKTLFSAGELTEASGGEQLKLPYSVMKELFAILQREKLCEVKGHGEPLGVLYRYTLTEEGRKRAQAYLDVNRYVGPAPVPLSHYTAMIEKQPVGRLRLIRPRLSKRRLTWFCIPRPWTKSVRRSTRVGRSFCMALLATAKRSLLKPSDECWKW